MALSESTKRIGEAYRAKLEAAWVAKPDVRRALKDAISFIPKDQHTTVFLSSGLDSHACLFAAMDNGLNVSATSFTLDTHESTDFKIARETAEILKIPFHPVVLRTDVDYLKKWVKYAVLELELVAKPDIECMWPLSVALKKTDAKHILTGFDSDVFFMSNKKPSMHAKQILAKYKRFSLGRAKLQQILLKNLALRIGKQVHYPFLEHGYMYMAMQHENDYVKLNSPQKALLREAYAKEMTELNVKRHQSFQLGDTGISKIFEILLDSDWNTRGAKSVKSIYNDVRKGVIK